MIAISYRAKLAAVIVVLALFIPIKLAYTMDENTSGPLWNSFITFQTPNNAEAKETSLNLTGRIAFVQNGNVWIANPDGSGQHQLTTMGNCSEPAWSPDANRIAYIHKFIVLPSNKEAFEIRIFDVTNYQDLIAVPAELTPFVLLGTYYRYYNPRWSPDGNSLYYIAADGRAVGDYMHKYDLITHQKDQNFYTHHADSIDVAWTDGRLLFYEYFNGIPIGDSLEVANPDGSGIWTLVPLVNEASISAPCWSPDGTHVAYINGTVYNPFTSIVVITSINTNRQDFIPSGTLSFGSVLSWSPDGSHIIYDSNGFLYILDLSNGLSQSIIPGEDPSWSVGFYSITGHMINSASNPINGVSVSAGSGYNGITDSQGNYKITNLPAGTYIVTPSLPGYSFTPLSRSVTVPPNANGVDFAALSTLLKLLIVPLNWQNTQETFNTEAHVQTDLFLDEISLNNCRNRVVIDILNVSTQNYNDFSCSLDDCRVNSIRTFVQDTLKIDPATYDVIIGLAETSPCAPIMGCSNRTNTIWSSAEYDLVTAHELGHIYNLSEEYCSNQAGSTDERCNDGDSQGDGAASGDVNWLDGNLPYDCPPDGSNDSGGSPCCNFGGNSCSEVNYGVCCLGNKNDAGGRSTMSFANAPGPRGFDVHDLNYLDSLQDLNCGTQNFLQQSTFLDNNAAGNQAILDINLLVHPDDTVTKENISIHYGRQTTASVLAGKTGDYSLHIIDRASNIIWSHDFSVYFDYEGPMVLGVDYSGITYDAVDVSLRIPHFCGMNILDLYHGEEMIFSDTLPPGCPVFLPIAFNYH
jgi:Tol biopolymer transport system component